MPAHAVTTRSGTVVELGDLRPEERPALFALFAEVVAGGDGFPQRAPLTDADFDAIWGPSLPAVVAARVDGEVAGAYHVKPNFVGRAAHIANAGYVVDRARRGQGIGRALVEDSLVRARLLGFDAMQFNLVFESNPARRLYESLGFVATGRVPRAVEGEDAVIYWRSLDDQRRGQ